MSVGEQIKADLHWIVSIAAGTLVVSGMFYNLMSRVAVLENRVTTTEQNYVLLQNIDRRLARIEGKLGISPQASSSIHYETSTLP